MKSSLINWLAVVLATVFIIFMTTTANPIAHVKTNFRLDLILHFSGFGVWGLLWSRAVLLTWGGQRKSVILILLGITIFSLISEFIQLFIGHRTGEWADCLANFSGALVLALCYYSSYSYRDVQRHSQ